MTEPINPTNATTMHASMAISRRIHKQLVKVKIPTKIKNQYNRKTDGNQASLNLHCSQVKFCKRTNIQLRKTKKLFSRILEEKFNSNVGR